MIVIISGVTGVGVETFGKFLAASFGDVPLYRGDGLGHWDVDKLYDRWVYDDIRLNIEQHFSRSARSSKLEAIVTITDGTDSDLLRRLWKLNPHSLFFRLCVDSLPILAMRRRSWRADHLSSNYSEEFLHRPGYSSCAKYPCVEDARAADLQQETNVMFLSASNMFRSLGEALERLSPYHTENSRVVSMALDHLQRDGRVINIFAARNLVELDDCITTQTHISSSRRLKTSPFWLTLRALVAKARDRDLRHLGIIHRRKA